MLGRGSGQWRASPDGSQAGHGPIGVPAGGGGLVAEGQVKKALCKRELQVQLQPPCRVPGVSALNPP